MPAVLVRVLQKNRKKFYRESRGERVGEREKERFITL